MGKRELVKALGTNDELQAKMLLSRQLTAWHDEFTALRARREVTPADLDHAVWDHYTDTLERDEMAREQLPGDAEVATAMRGAVARVDREGIDLTDPLATLDVALDVRVVKEAREIAANARKVKLASMRRHLMKGEMALIADEVDAHVLAKNLLLDRSSPAWTRLARNMMRAEIEALQRALERDQGDYSGKPSDPLVKPPATPRPEAAEVAAPGETIMEAVEAFKNENPRNVSKGRIDESCRDIGIFMEITGTDFPVAKITKKHVREWKALLIKYPIRATEVTAFRGMTIKEIVLENEKLKRAILSDRTVNRYLSSLSAFCSWAENNGYIAANPCLGMSLPKEKKSKTLTFTSEQMNVLFNSPWFAGCKSADEWHNVAKPGNVLIRDHRFWVPLIMLFSGARPGEIGQLAVNDVRQAHGQWIMHISTEGDETDEGKSAKTPGSMRVVPVHPELIRLGFIRYRERRIEEGGTALFPGALRNERGQMMSDVSREFGKYLVRIGLKKGRGLSMYSFRHGTTDAFRRAGYLDEQFGFILGHSKETTTGKYGIIAQGMLQQRVELVNSISYEDLNLDHLLKL